MTKTPASGGSFSRGVHPHTNPPRRIGVGVYNRPLLLYYKNITKQGFRFTQQAVQDVKVAVRKTLKRKAEDEII